MVLEISIIKIILKNFLLISIFFGTILTVLISISIIIIYTTIAIKRITILFV